MDEATGRAGRQRTIGRFRPELADANVAGDVLRQPLILALRPAGLLEVERCPRLAAYDAAAETFLNPLLPARAREVIADLLEGDGADVAVNPESAAPELHLHLVDMLGPVGVDPDRAQTEPFLAVDEAPPVPLRPGMHP